MLTVYNFIGLMFEKSCVPERQKNRRISRKENHRTHGKKRGKNEKISRNKEKEGEGVPH